MDRVGYSPLSPMARYVIEAFEKKIVPAHEEAKITVNPVVSKFASWYERLRNAMEYREEEVILRATIERILKRRLLLGGNAKTTAEPLVRELLWARYLPDTEIPQSAVDKVEESIDLYLSLRLKILEKYKIPDVVINEWTYHLMSTDIQYILHPNHEREIMANFMFHVLRDDVMIVDDSEQTKDAQVFIAVRKAFARDDLAFLRYHLFRQFFGKLTRQNLEYTSENFMAGFREIINQINYPGREKVYTYVKRRTAAFLILEDVLHTYRDTLPQLLENAEEFEKAILEACDERYKGIRSKVNRAIIRSVLFILLTKVVFAFVVEGTYEKIFFHGINYLSISLNTTIPPLLMIIVSLFIQTPGVDNSRRILSYILELLYEENPRLGSTLELKKARKKHRFDAVFNILWFLAFILSFGLIDFALRKLHFNIISQFVFMFFLAIVSFFSYRISLIAHTYTVGEKQNLFTPIVDFLFMPVIRVGRQLSQSIAQVNIFIFFFDFFIETPFKLLFAFFEQWFYYLHTKTEELE